jgi:hypothetical protein
VTDETDYFRLADHPRSKRTPKPRAIAGGGAKEAELLYSTDVPAQHLAGRTLST